MKIRTNHEVKWSPFSKKALWSMNRADAFINIWEGAVRSSKTVASIIAWLAFIEASPHHTFLMTGKTADTIFRNVIGGDYGILSIMGPDQAKFQKGGDGGAALMLQFPVKDPKYGKPKVVQKVCYIVGANDAQAESKVRGMTVAGWYADEVTLYPETMVKQSINRMSLSGARAFWTCNPDSPYHFIKTDFIDKAKEKGYRVFHFELDDNLSLEDWFKDNIKAAYSGLWYKRMILGLWVMADGVIYDNFVHQPMGKGGHIVDDADLPRFTRFWVGIDYGQSNATTFMLLALGEDKRMYVLDEYYHSGKESKVSKSPSQYSRDLKDWLRDIPTRTGIFAKIEAIWVDPSAKGFIVQAWQDGVKGIRAADNDVKLGIELVTNIIGTDRYRVHRRCKNHLRELASYVWDPNAQKRGEDKPIKENDHTCDPVRYVANATRPMWLTAQAA